MPPGNPEATCRGGYTFTLSEKSNTGNERSGNNGDKKTQSIPPAYAFQQGIGALFYRYYCNTSFFRQTE